MNEYESIFGDAPRWAPPAAHPTDGDGPWLTLGHKDSNHYVTGFELAANDHWWHGPQTVPTARTKCGMTVPWPHLWWGSAGGYDLFAPFPDERADLANAGGLGAWNHGIDPISEAEALELPASIIYVDLDHVCHRCWGSKETIPHPTFAGDVACVNDYIARRTAATATVLEPT